MNEYEILFESDDEHVWQTLLMEMNDEQRLKQLQKRCDEVADFIDAELDFREGIIES